MICEDVELGHTTATSVQRQGSAELPVGAITAAAGVPSPLGDSANPKFTVDKSHGAANSFGARFGSSQIFAVELRKITTRWFNSKELRLQTDGPGNIDPSRLASNEEDEDEDLERAVDPEDLICVELGPRDLDDMACY